MKNKKITRMIAAGILCAFCASNTLWGNPIPSVREPAPVFVDVSKIQIPSELGSVQEFKANSSKETVILIQDAHGVLDAQQNIRKLIQLLQEKYRVESFAVEGSKGKLDTTLLRAFPDDFIKQKVLGQYFSKGELTGVDLAAILNSKPAVFYGLEDWRLYQENYVAYMMAVKNQENIDEKITTIEETFDAERARVYPAEFNRFHDSVASFRKEKTGLLELLKELKTLETARPEAEKKIKEQNASHLFNLMAALAKDDGKSQDVDADIRQMGEKFQNMFRFKLSLDTSREFNKHFQNYKTGEEDGAVFLKFMVDTGKSFGFKPRLTLGMKELLGQAETFTMIQGTKLFEELQAVLKDYENTFAVTPELKEMAMKYERLRLLGDMARLQLVRAQMDEYQKDAEAYLSLLGEAREWMTPAIKFYQAARGRDDAFILRIQQIFKKEKAGTLVIMAGGFHSEGLRENLKKQGYSYMVLTPAMESLNGHENYEKIMTGDVSYRDYVKKSFYDAFIRHSTLSLVKELNEPDFKKSLKLWRDQVIRDLADQGRLAESGDYNIYIDSLFSVYKEKFGEGVRISKTRDSILRDMEAIVLGFTLRAKEKVRAGFKSQLTEFMAGAAELSGQGKLTSESVALLSSQIEAGKAGVNTYRVLGNKGSDVLTQVFTGAVSLEDADNELSQVTAKAELRVSGTIPVQGTTRTTPAEDRLGRILQTDRSAVAGGRISAPASRIDRVMLSERNLRTTPRGRPGSGAVRNAETVRVSVPAAITLDVAVAAVSAEFDPLPGFDLARQESALFDALTEQSSLKELLPEFQKVKIGFPDPKMVRQGVAALYFDLLDKDGNPIKTQYHDGSTQIAHVLIEGDGESVNITAVVPGEKGSALRKAIGLEFIRVAVRYVEETQKKNGQESKYKKFKLTNLNKFSRKFFNENLAVLMKNGQPLSIPDNVETYLIPFDDMNLETAITARAELREAEGTAEIAEEDVAERLATIAEQMKVLENGGQGGDITAKTNNLIRQWAETKGNGARRLALLPAMQAFIKQPVAPAKPRNIPEAVLQLLNPSGSSRDAVLRLLATWFKTDTGDGEMNDGIRLTPAAVKVQLGLALIRILEESIVGEARTNQSLIRILKMLDRDADFSEGIADEFEELDGVVQRITAQAGATNTSAQDLARAFSQLNFFRASFELVRGEYEIMQQATVGEFGVVTTGDIVIQALARAETRAEPYKIYQEILLKAGSSGAVTIYAKLTRRPQIAGQETIEERLVLEAYVRGTSKPIVRREVPLENGKVISVGSSKDRDFQIAVDGLPVPGVSKQTVDFKVEYDNNSKEWVLSSKNYLTTNPLVDADDLPTIVDDLFRPAPVILRYSTGDTVEIRSTTTKKVFDINLSLAGVNAPVLTEPGQKSGRNNIPGNVISRQAQDIGGGSLGTGRLYVEVFRNSEAQGQIKLAPNGDIIIENAGLLRAGSQKFGTREVRIRFDNAKNFVKIPELTPEDEMVNRFVKSRLTSEELFARVNVIEKIFSDTYGLKDTDERNVSEQIEEALKLSDEPLLLKSVRFVSALNKNHGYALAYAHRIYVIAANIKSSNERENERKAEKIAAEILTKAGDDAASLLKNYVKRSDEPALALQKIFARYPEVLRNLQRAAAEAITAKDIEVRLGRLEAEINSLSDPLAFEKNKEGIRKRLDDFNREIGTQSWRDNLRARLQDIERAWIDRGKRLVEQDKKLKKAQRAVTFRDANKKALARVNETLKQDSTLVKELLDIKTAAQGRFNIGNLQIPENEIEQMRYAYLNSFVQKVLIDIYGIEAGLSERNSKYRDAIDAFFDVLETLPTAKAELRFVDSEAELVQQEQEGISAGVTAVIELGENPAAFDNLSGLNKPEIRDQFLANPQDPGILTSHAENIITTGISPALDAAGQSVIDRLRNSENVVLLVGSAEFKAEAKQAYQKAGIDSFIEIDEVIAELQMAPYLDFSNAVENSAAGSTDQQKVAAHDAFLDNYIANSLRKDETVAINIADAADIEPVVEALKSFYDAGIIGRLIIMFSEFVKIQQKIWAFAVNRLFVRIKQNEETSVLSETARKEEILTGDLSIVLTSQMDLTQVTEPAARDLLMTALGQVTDPNMKRILFKTALAIAIRVKQLTPEERGRFKENPDEFRTFLEREGFSSVAGSIGFGNKGFLQITVDKFVASFKTEAAAAKAA